MDPDFVLPTSTIRVAIVGGGPYCTYSLERLAATASELPEDLTLEVHVFERSGEFGSGIHHSSRQSPTSYLNRVAGQVGFGADESVAGAGPLLPKELRPSLHKWCQGRFAQTGDSSFNLSSGDWPKRYIHGQALSEQFHKYVKVLQSAERITVQLHATEVTDIIEVADGLKLVTHDKANRSLVVHYLLAVTGHPNSDPNLSLESRERLEFASLSGAEYVHCPYPLESNLTIDNSGPGRTVGCIGMGLSAIDVALFLTVGRGGQLKRNSDGQLSYLPSGMEPDHIIFGSGSGTFTHAKPEAGRSRQRQPVFFTEEAIGKLRQSVGAEAPDNSFTQPQLDFELHVLPLIMLEMAVVYYGTLFGDDFTSDAVEKVFPHYQLFLDGNPSEDGNRLEELMESIMSDRIQTLDSFITNRIDYGMTGIPDWAANALDRFVTVAYGEPSFEAKRGRVGIAGDNPRTLNVSSLDAETTPWGFFPLPSQNKFSWNTLVNPIGSAEGVSGSEYTEMVLRFMRRDHLWAIQDSGRNPAKAAIDGVWRDLRRVIRFAVEFGGLSAESHEVFVNVYLRHYNRLINGASVAVMEQILALIEHGVVDVSLGPLAAIRTSRESFEMVGSTTEGSKLVDTLVDARLAHFNPDIDAAPLYRALIGRGIIKKWGNPSAKTPGKEFQPGGLDVTSDFHPIRLDGTVNHRLTFLGIPCEGAMFYKHGALKPDSNHQVIQDVIIWVSGLWKEIRGHSKAAESIAGAPQL